MKKSHTQFFCKLINNGAVKVRFHWSWATHSFTLCIPCLFSGYVILDFWSYLHCQGCKQCRVLAEISHALWLSKLSRRRVAKFKCHGVDNAERFPGWCVSKCDIKGRWFVAQKWMDISNYHNIALLYILEPTRLLYKMCPMATLAWSYSPIVFKSK